MIFNFSNKSKYPSKSSLIFLINIILVFFLDNSYAESVRDRFRICSPKGGEGTAIDIVSVESLQWREPVVGGGPDFEFEMDNPFCLPILLGSYALVKAAIYNMNRSCGYSDTIPRITPSLLQDSIDITRATVKAAQTKNPTCMTAVAAAGVALGSFAADMRITHAAAKDIFENSRLCGSNWKRWNAQTMLKDIANIQENRNQWIKDNPDKVRSPNPMDYKEYREWYYNGEEFEDNSCSDVTKEKTLSSGETVPTGISTEQRRVLESNGLKYPPQKYYMRGSETPNYNCDKYNLNKIPDSNALTADQKKDYEQAYNCCVKKSQTTICIEYKKIGVSTYNYKFCEAGNRCVIDGVTFSAGYKFDNRLICANSYSLCPYNFNIGGGTAECDYFQDSVNGNSVTPEDVEKQDCGGKSEVRRDDCTFNNKAGKCRNYCQMLENCVVTDSNYYYESSITSPYFSRACMDFVGDSKNNQGYDSGIFAGNRMHFTAPIAQCVKETLENVFYNRAGHSQCLNVSEVPDKNGVCYSGTYIYKQGSNVKQQSFFSILQDNIKAIVKMILTLLVTVTGIKILLGGQFLKRNELVMMVVKISIVTYFATGDAWQSTFFNGVYNGSSVISQLVMKINVNADESKRDGCQFGKITLTSGTIGNTVDYAGTIDLDHYPTGKEYLAVWDTLDCKIARYLGYSPTASVANIAKLIAAGLFTGPIGIYFIVLLLIFGFYMILAALRALHIFLVSSMSIIIMVYISVITIPAILFKKTENIFKNWLSNLIGFSLQPIMLFAYVGIFITAFDQVMLGSATFSGNPPAKTISCDAKCYDQNGQIVTTKEDGTPIIDANSDCDLANNQKIIDPNSDSVACIVNIEGVSSWPGFEIFGISLPIIKDLFTRNGRDKILTLMKAALLIYILAEFIDQIPAIASSIAGGRGLATRSIKIKNMVAGTAGALTALQKRATRGSFKAIKATKDKTTDTFRQLGDKGSKVETPEKAEADNKKSSLPNDYDPVGRQD